MLCPKQGCRVEGFPERIAPNGKRIYKCPHCNSEVPSEYARDASTFPVAAVSLVGSKTQGKSVLLGSLAQELEVRTERWTKGYYAKPINKEHWDKLKAKADTLDRGLVPDGTQMAVDSLVLQIEDVPKPRLGRCRLVFFDIGGETFYSVHQIVEKASYALHTSSVVLLIDPNDESALKELPMVLANYLEALRQVEVNPKTRALLVVLTKGDMLKGRANVPQELLRFLDREDDPEEEDDLWFALERLSALVEGYLDRGPQLGNFTRQARKELGAVKYCVVSSLGAEPQRLQNPAPGEPKQRLRISPVRRGVMLPVYWLWAMKWLARVSWQGGTYFSLRWVVEKANAHDVIRLGPGRQLLPVPLTIDKPLTLRGTKRTSESVQDTHPLPSRVIVEWSTGSAVQIRVPAGQCFTAEDLSFELSRPDLHCNKPGPNSADLILARRKRRCQTPKDVVVVLTGEVQFTRCSFKGGEWDTTQQHPGSGLRFLGTTTGQVVGCEASDNGGYGILVCDESTPVLENCRCCRNEHSGGGFRDKSMGTARGNSFTDNEVAGIVISGDAQPSLERNRLSNNKQQKQLDSRTNAGLLNWVWRFLWSKKRSTSRRNRSEE